MSPWLKLENATIQEVSIKKKGQQALSEPCKPVSYTCGHCGERVNSIRGDDWAHDSKTGETTQVLREAKIRVCSGCHQPTFFDGEGRQFPGTEFGETVDHLPADIKRVYNEARACMSVSAYTSAALACRKLLQNLSVHLSAPGNKSFAFYVQWLVDNNHVPQPCHGWIDSIRKLGNEATHEIPAINREAAKDAIKFSEMLLKIIFEYPYKVTGAAPTSAPATP